MDFKTFVRRDLQFLCKLNKIPANRTNVAMAEALSSLDIVKGIEKFCKSTESSVAESSVESPEKDVVTSPKTARTGRRKQVREGSGVVLTATPVARRNRRGSSVKTLQTVYNTRLSARLSRKQLRESKEECVEGEDTSAMKMKSEVLENNVEEFQISEMPSHNNMAVVDVSLYEKKDDVGVGICLSETDTIAEVITNDDKVFQLDANKAETSACQMKAAVPISSPQEKGSVDVGFLYSKNEVQSGSPQSGNGENIDAQVTAFADMKAVAAIPISSPQEKGSVDVEFFYSKNEAQSGSPQRGNGENIDAQVTAFADMKAVAAIPISSPQEKGSVDVGFLYSKNEVQSGRPQRGNGENIDAQVTAFADLKAVAAIPISSPQEKGSVDVEFLYSTNEVQKGTSTSQREDCENFDVQVTALAEMKAVDLNGKDVDLKDTAATNMKSKLLENNVEGFEIHAVEAVVEMPRHEKRAELDMLLHEKKDDVVADSSLSGINLITEVLKPVGEMRSYDHKAVVELPHNKLMEFDDVVADLPLLKIGVTAEVLANEVKLLPTGTEKAEVLMPIQKTRVVEQVFSPQKKGSNDVEVQFSYLEAGESLDAAVTRLIDSNERESLKEHLEMESIKNFNCGERVHDMIIQPKSQKVLFECWSSSENNFVDGESLDVSVKIQQDISFNSELGGVYEEELTSQEEISGKAIASDLNVYSESNEKFVDFEQSDSKRKPVSGILSCIRAVEFADHLEMTGTIQATNDFFGEVPFVDESGDKDSLADDPESNSKTFDNNTNEVGLLPTGTEKAEILMPIQKTRVVEQVFSPQKKVSDDVKILFSYSEAGESLDAAVACLVDSNERESLKEHLEMESSENFNCGERVNNMIIQTKSQTVMFKCWSSAENNFVDGENLDVSVKIQQDISCNSESSGVYEEELTSKEISGKAIASDLNVYSESNENFVDFEQSVSKRKPVSGNLSCIRAVEFTDHLEMTGTIQATNDFFGEVPFVDESGDKDSLADDPESNSKTFDNNTNEVGLLPTGTEKAEGEMPIQNTKAVDQVFSPQKKGSEDVVVHFSLSEGSDDVKVHFDFLEADKNVDAAVTHLTDNDERESLKGHLKLDSSEKVNYGEGVREMMIQPKSEKLMFECWSSGANNFVDGEDFDISVKIQEDISCNSESGVVYDDVKRLTYQEEISGKAIASDLHIYSESNERIETSIHNDSGDDTSFDTDFFQHDIYSKQPDSKRKSVSGIFSCNGAVEFADQLEMTSPIETTFDFSGGVPYVDDTGDKDGLANDSESDSKTFVNNSSDTEADSDFLEYSNCSKQQNRKRESIASQIFGSSCTREPADQSESPESSSKTFFNSYCGTEADSDFLEYAICPKQDDGKRESIASQIFSSSCTKQPAYQSEAICASVGLSSEMASNHQLVSGNSTTKESGPLVARDVSFCCLGVNANISYTPSSTASKPSTKLGSNVSEDKENMGKMRLGNFS